MGPGDEYLIASATASSTGDANTNAINANATSSTRFQKPLMPCNGESQIEKAGIPLISTQRACTRSKAKMLGTKYTDAVVSRNSLSSSSMRGAVEIGNAR